MIHGKYIGQGEDLSEVLSIRKTVFENGGDELRTYDLNESYDPMALNAIIDLDGKNIGAARLVLDIIEDRFYVDDLCILDEYRGNSYGEFALRMLADKAFQCNAEEIWANVPGFAKGFFKKMFFEEEGKMGELTVMKAGLSKFQGCCHSKNDKQEPKNSPDAVEVLSACGKTGGCASCGGCSSSLKQSITSHEDRRYR